MRRWLFDHNWQIVDEELVLENDRYYQIIISEPSYEPKAVGIDKKPSRKEGTAGNRAVSSKKKHPPHTISPGEN